MLCKFLSHYVFFYETYRSTFSDLRKPWIKNLNSEKQKVNIFNFELKRRVYLFLRLEKTCENLHLNITIFAHSLLQNNKINKPFCQNGCQNKVENNRVSRILKSVKKWNWSRIKTEINRLTLGVQLKKWDWKEERN